MLAYQMNEWDVKDCISKYPKADIFYKVDYADEESARVRIICGCLAFDQAVKGKEVLEVLLKFLEEKGGRP